MYLLSFWEKMTVANEKNQAKKYPHAMAYNRIPRHEGIYEFR